MSDGEKNPIQAAQTTLRIVETLKELDGVGVIAVTKQLDMPKSSIYNYLSTLHQERYVLTEGQKYHIGLRFLEAGAFARHRQSIYETARSEINAWAAETGELVNLGTIEHGMVYLYRESGEKGSGSIHTPASASGLTIPLWARPCLPTSSKRMSEGSLAITGAQTTEHTITDSEALFEELGQIRERGVAFDREERISGLRCVAAPILNKGNEIEGALSVSSPTSRMKGKRFTEEIPELVRDTVNVIEVNMAHL